MLVCTDNLRFSVLGFPQVSPLILPFPFGSFSELKADGGLRVVTSKGVSEMEAKESLAEVKRSARNRGMLESK